MKKILSFAVIAAIMIAAAVPVYAAVPTEEEKEKIYNAYVQYRWELFLDYMEDYPEQKDDIGTFEDYCKNFTPVDEMYAMDFYGNYGENQLSFWRICFDIVPLWCKKIVGDYCILIKSVDENAFCVYTDGRLLNLFDAYEIGAVTDDDLAALNDSHEADSVMQRLGDMNNDKKLDVADIIALKNTIMEMSEDDYIDYMQADFDKNGSINVGDIVSMKNYIITK